MICSSTFLGFLSLKVFFFCANEERFYKSIFGGCFNSLKKNECHILSTSPTLQYLEPLHMNF